MKRVSGFPIPLPAAIFCAAAVMIAWPFAGGSLHAGQTGHGIMLAAQEGQTAAKSGPEGAGGSQAGKDESFAKDAKKALRDVNKQIAALGKEMKKQGEEAKAGAKDSWNDVKEKQRVAKTKLQELSKAGGDAWEKAKADFNGALDDLKNSYHKAADAFK